MRKHNISAMAPASGRGGAGLPEYITSHGNELVVVIVGLGLGLEAFGEGSNEFSQSAPNRSARPVSQYF